MYKFKAKDGAANKVFRTKHFKLFSPAPEGRPLPGAYGMAGLVAAGAVITDRVAMGHGFVSGSSAAKGVLAVYQNKKVTGDNVKNKGANCAGPIFWWGLADRDAALKVCKTGKF